MNNMLNLENITVSTMLKGIPIGLKELTVEILKKNPNYFRPLTENVYTIQQTIGPETARDYLKTFVSVPVLRRNEIIGDKYLKNNYGI